MANAKVIDLAEFDAPAAFPERTAIAIVDEFLAQVLEQRPQLRKGLEMVNRLSKQRTGLGIVNGAMTQQINALFPSASDVHAGGVALPPTELLEVIWVLHFVRQIKLFQREFEALRLRLVGPQRQSEIAELEAQDFKAAGNDAAAVERTQPANLPQLTSAAAREYWKLVTYHPSADTIIGAKYRGATAQSLPAYQIFAQPPPNVTGADQPFDAAWKGTVPALPNTMKAPKMLTVLYDQLRAYADKRFTAAGFQSGEATCPVGQDMVVKFHGQSVPPHLVPSFVAALRQYGSIDGVTVTCAERQLGIRPISMRDLRR